MSNVPDHREHRASRVSQYLSLLPSADNSTPALKELQSEFGFEPARLDVDRCLLRVTVELLAIGTTDSGAQSVVQCVRNARPDWFYQGLAEAKLLRGYPVEDPHLAVASEAAKGGAAAPPAAKTAT